MDDKIKSIVNEYARLIEGQKEDIIKGFVAKYGVEPGEEVVQAHFGNRWTVVKITPEEYHRIREAVIAGRAAQEFVDKVRALLGGMNVVEYTSGHGMRDSAINLTLEAGHALAWLKEQLAEPANIVRIP